MKCCAGFWIRVLACLIDVLIVMPALIISEFGALQFQPPRALFILNLTILAIWWAYSAGLESSPWQGTLGKLICGLKVTDLNGNRITFARAFGRFLVKLCLLTFPFAFLLYLSVAFNKHKLGLHDRIAGTCVLRKSCSPAPSRRSPNISEVNGI